MPGADPAGRHALLDLARDHGRERVDDGPVGGLDIGVVAGRLVDGAQQAAVLGVGVDRRFQDAARGAGAGGALHLGVISACVTASNSDSTSSGSPSKWR